MSRFHSFRNNPNTNNTISKCMEIKKKIQKIIIIFNYIFNTDLITLMIFEGT